MFQTIGDFLGQVAVYIAALLGLVALYFLWVAFREWRTGTRATFGVERDIANSEMIGAITRAGVLIFVGLLVVGLGWVGRQSESDDTAAQGTRPPVPTTPTVATLTPGSAAPAPTLFPTDTPQPVSTDIPPVPEAATETPPLEPTPQTAVVNTFGGVWLRDAPNGGTVVVLPENTVVELLEGRETAGNYEWQKIRVLENPPGSEAQVGQEGWVALQFLQVNP